MTEQTKKNTPHWGRHISKGVYYSANIFLPLSELRFTASKICPSVLNHLKQVKHLSPSRHLEQKRQEPMLSFEEAVATSGMTVETLIHRFQRRKQLCLALAAVPSLLIISVLIVIAASGIYTPLLLAKAFAIILALLSLAALPFVQALSCTWRIWQLRERRASPHERGGFKDFLKQTRWLNATISPWR